jgi:hypothetical protein
MLNYIHYGFCHKNIIIDYNKIKKHNCKLQ